MGDPEIHHARPTLIIDSDVGRLDVAMDDAAFVRERESAEDVDDDVELVDEWESDVSGREVLEVLTLDELHRDEQVAVDFAEVVDRDDVRVLERSSGLGLAEEPPSEVVVASDRVAHHFDGNGAIEDRIGCAIDDTHRALADLLDDSVLPDLCDPRLRHSLESWTRASQNSAVRGGAIAKLHSSPLNAAVCFRERGERVIFRETVLRDG